MKATKKNILELIVEADILVNEVDIKSNVNLSEQGIDSLDIVNVYLLIEEKFEITIPDEDLSSVKTIDDIVIYINSK